MLMWLLYYSFCFFLFFFSHFLHSTFFPIPILLLLLPSFCFCVFTFLSVHVSNGLNLSIAVCVCVSQVVSIYTYKLKNKLASERKLTRACTYNICICMAHVRDTTKLGLVDGARLYRYILRLLWSGGACSIFTASE